MIGKMNLLFASSRKKAIIIVVAGIFAVGFFPVLIFRRTEFSPYEITAVRIFRRTETSPYGIFAVWNFRRTEFLPFEIFAVMPQVRGFMVFSSS